MRKSKGSPSKNDGQLSARDVAAPPLESKMMSLVSEYMKFNGFSSTLKTLEGEYRAKYAYNSNNEERERQQHDGLEGAGDILAIKNSLLAFFDAAEVSKLNKYFIKFIPESIRNHNIDCQKLEFYLNIHCAIQPFRISSLKSYNGDAVAAAKAAVSSIHAFSKFLNTRGQVLSENPEFLPFYALPYIPNPIDHPSFKPIFEARWVTNLRYKLSVFLDSALVQYKNSNPELYRLVEKAVSTGSVSVAGSGRAGAELLRQSKKDLTLAESSEEMSKMFIKKEMELQEAFGNRETKLREFSYHIYMTAVELLQNLVKLVATYDRDNKIVHPDVLPNSYKKLELYASVLTSKVGSQLPPAVLTVVPPSSFSSNNTAHNSANSSLRNTARSDGKSAGIKAPGLKNQINFKAIKEALLGYITAGGEAADKDGALLLQALRWRLTKSKMKVRKANLKDYIDCDIFNTRGTIKTSDGGETRENLLNKIISECPATSLTLEYMMRLVNVMASESTGRGYMLGDENCLPTLVRLLNEEPRDTITRQNALGTLQKFSLRRKPQNLMINLNVVDWIVTTLKSDTSNDEPQQISEYTIEYATALLMNLCLRSAGKTKAENPALDILSVLSGLMESENTQVRTYINGTLYSILSRASLKERGMEIGIDEILRRLYDKSEENFQKQIEYILKQLLAETVDKAESDDEGEEDEEDQEKGNDDDSDDLPVEEYEEETLEARGGEGLVDGEMLLMSKYSLKAVTAATRTKKNRQAVSDESKRNGVASGGKKKSGSKAKSKNSKAAEEKGEEDDDSEGGDDDEGQEEGADDADEAGEDAEEGEVDEGGDLEGEERDEDGEEERERAEGGSDEGYITNAQVLELSNLVPKSMVMVPEEMRSRDRIPRTPTRSYDSLSQEALSFLGDISGQGQGSYSLQNTARGYPSSSDTPYEQAAVNAKDPLGVKPVKPSVQFEEVEGALVNAATRDEYIKAFSSKRELMRTPAGDDEWEGDNGNSITTANTGNNRTTYKTSPQHVNERPAYSTAGGERATYKTSPQHVNQHPAAAPSPHTGTKLRSPKIRPSILKSKK